MDALLDQAGAALHEALDAFDPASHTDVELSRVIERLAWVEKFCAAARVKAACALRSRGDRCAAEAMAKATGTSAARSRRAIDARINVETCSEPARELLDRGELSLEQADEIAKTAAEVPGSEPEMIEFARRYPLSALRDEGRKRRLRVMNRDVLSARQHAARHVRVWTNDIGNTCFIGEVTPKAGAAFVQRLTAETDRIYRRAYREGRREPTEAYAADAFINIVSGAVTKGKHDRSELIVVVDVNAYRRGNTEDGEVCQIVGGSPIPVSLAREMEKDAFLKAVLHDGTIIHTVKHFGRRIPAELRTALQVGPPPEFDGMICEHCGGRIGLEIDHLNPLANGGATEATNIGPKCRCSHGQKTALEMALGLFFGRDPPAGT